MLVLDELKANSNCSTIRTRKHSLVSLHKSSNSLMMLTFDLEVPVTTLPVSPLSEQNIVNMISTALKCSPKDSTPLARLIHAKTRGNLFFTLHFFKSLYHKSLLWFNWSTSSWCWDISHIEYTENTDNVIDFLVSALKRTPPHVMTLLYPAACMGHIFNMDTIRQLPSCQSINTLLEHALQIALHQGFLLHTKDSTYRFQHDRVQQAVYSLLSERDKQLKHLEIGRALLKQFLKGK